VGQARLREEEPEGLEAEVTAADVLVAVDARARRPLAVVDVDRPDVPEPDRALQVGHGGREALGGPDRVARGVEVLGVEAHAHPVAAGHEAEEVAELLEAMPDRGPLPGRGLEEEHRRVVGPLLVERVDRLRDPPDPGPLAPPEVGAGVEHDVRDPERLAALVLDHEPGDRLAPLALLRLGQVDEVAGVRHGRLDARAPARVVPRE